ncbi:MAG: Lrp/AsnC ligand binding domain-containing protein [Anaerolineales bacterium]|nr:Lrp/AsnC ligand binding domain-containing protein [Anaerolineales bacterium]MCB8990436.1 Lrp/AsnC ligand binding domain-containing protein [Ardenticatenaceae bacterium]MCB9003450.1 Lrp/AsnC ligand binding domain-containing protein [Ardenticatenaceae bacterium]
MKAYILINIRIGSVNDVIHHLRRIDNVIEANMTFGPYDAVAIIQADDVNHLGRILADAIQPIPGVTETLTCLAVEV